MGIITVSTAELQNVMQFINVVKVKFKDQEMWDVVPVLYTTDDSIVVIIESDSKNFSIPAKHELVMKFQKYGYEYLVSGYVAEGTSKGDGTLTIKCSIAQKYYNLRKYMRFDTNLKALIKEDENLTVENAVKNISKGGAMVVTDLDLELNSKVNIEIIFTSGNSVTAIGKILRKSSYKHSFSYGVQFVTISEENSIVIDKEISAYEKEYFKSLSILKEYNKKGNEYLDTKIAIFSNEPDESYDIREILVKLGLENFDLFQNFKFYIDFFTEEKPRILIIDTTEITDEVKNVIDQIQGSFSEINIIVLLPLEYAENEDILAELPEDTHVLFKPLILNEFEEVLIKYI